MDSPDNPSTRTPFGEVEKPHVHHEIIKSEGLPPTAFECACGLRVEGPEAKDVMEFHIISENDWDE